MPLLLIVASFAFLLRNVYGTIAPYRDSGDLIASAFSLGIAHPPGYSLYTLLTHIGIKILPFANVAYRANLLSCLWTSLAVAILYQILKKESSPFPALLAILVWFLSPSVQRLSLVSEMYSLHALFCAGVLWAVLGRNFYLAFFLAGLAMLNQPTIVFIVPGILAAWWALGQNHEEKLRAGVLFGVLALLGFSLVLYYPLRAMQGPLINWGDPETLRNLWRLITRADYGGLKLHPEESRLAWNFQDLADQLKLFALTEWRELGILGTATALLGLAFSGTMDKTIVLVSALTFFSSGPLFFILSNLPIHEQSTVPILEPYLLMTNLFLLPWLAIGFNRMKILFIVLLLYFVFCSARLPSHRRDFLGVDYGKNLLRTMPPHSSIYEPDDTTAFVLSYFQTVEGRREDIAVLVGMRTKWGYEQIMKKYPDLLPGMSFPSAPAFIAAMLEGHLKTGRPLWSDHSSKFPGEVANLPVGLLSRAWKTDAERFEEAQGIFSFYTERGNVFLDREDEFFSRHLLSRWSAATNNIGIVEQGFNRFRQAENSFRLSLLREPKLSQGWTNLGINFYLQNRYREAEDIFSRGLEKLGPSEILYYYLGLCQRRLNESQKARASLGEVLKLNPRHLDALNETGLLDLDEQSWEAAMARFKQCLAINPAYEPARYNLGLVLRLKKL